MYTNDELMPDPLKEQKRQCFFHFLSYLEMNSNRQHVKSLFACKVSSISFLRSFCSGLRDKSFPVFMWLLMIMRGLTLSNEIFPTHKTSGHFLSRSPQMLRWIKLSLTTRIYCVAGFNVLNFAKTLIISVFKK